MSPSIASVAVLALAAMGEARTVIQKREVPRPRFGSVPYGAEVISCTKPGVIALTFDDGPGPLTSGIVDKLEAAGAKGTFFVVGKNGADGLVTGDYTALIQRMHDAGHHIGSHSFSHPNFNEISYDQKVQELVKNEKAFEDILGFVPTYFRPPYTACNGECYQALGDLGYHVTDYDLDTKDWEDKGVNAKEKYANAIRYSNPESSSFIALAHDIQPYTAEVLVDYMLEVGKEKGYRFVTLGECLGDAPGNWYRDPESGEPVGDAPEPTTTSAKPTSTKAPPPKTTAAPPSASPGINKESSVPVATAESSAVESEAESTATDATATATTTVTSAVSTGAASESVSESEASSTGAAAGTSTGASDAAETGDAEEDDDDTEPSSATLRVPSVANALIASLAGLAAWALL